MNRRDMLGALAGGALSPFVAAAAEPPAPKPAPKRLGLCTDSNRARAKVPPPGLAPLFDPLNYLEYCHSLGAGGIQMPLGRREEAYCARLRAKAEAYGMFIEGSSGLPRDAADLDRFEAEVRTARQAGAGVIRVVLIGGRRYEDYRSPEEFRARMAPALRSLELAEPIAARHRVRLAVENHKDHRIDERLELLKRLDSEYVGACVDTGNNIALLDDAMEVVEAFAPWAFAVHLKDAAVKECASGFLLIDLPLGEGYLDLPRMVDVIRKARPETQIVLELIVREPLEVPCLAEAYWGTMAGVPARDLARILRTVRAHEHQKPLPPIGKLKPDELVRLEEEFIKRSMAYALEHLGL